MILKYFRTNQTAIQLALPLVAGLFWALHFFDSEPAFMVRGFLFEKLNSALVISPLISKISALVLISLQAFLINSLLNQSEVFSKITHIPLLILIILGSMLSFRGGLEPMMIANVFLILALHSSLQIYHQNSAISLTFNTGFWIGMAALFEPACLILILPALISILVLRAADWRELFFLLIGGIMPLSFLWTICFATDTEWKLSENYFHPVFQQLPYIQSALFNFFLIVTGMVLLWSFYFYAKSLRGVIIRIRKMRMVLLYFSFSLLAMYSFLFFTPFLPAQNQILLLPGVILISYLLIHHPRPFLTDVFVYVMIVLWSIFVYNLYFS